MPRPAVVVVLLIDRNDGEGHGMRKTRVFGQLMGVQGMVVGDVTMQPDPDGDGEVLIVSVRLDARSAGRCETQPVRIAERHNGKAKRPSIFLRSQAWASAKTWLWLPSHS